MILVFKKNGWVFQKKSQRETFNVPINLTVATCQRGFRNVEGKGCSTVCILWKCLAMKRMFSTGFRYAVLDHGLSNHTEGFNPLLRCRFRVGSVWMGLRSELFSCACALLFILKRPLSFLELFTSFFPFWLYRCSSLKRLVIFDF